MNAEADVGVIFDMDGVLIDSAEAHFESWRVLAAECNVEVTRAQFEATFGRRNPEIIPALFLEQSAEGIKRLADRKESIFRRSVRSNPPIVEGAIELMRGVREAGARVAVGSSAPRENIDFILDAMGVLDADIVSDIVSGAEGANGKLDRQVFTLNCERMGLPASRCVAVEDAPAGIQAARAAGTRAVAVLIYHPSEAFDGADLLVDRLADLSVAKLLSLVMD